uniref:Uncharacterized protein n=1 Tax=Globisporangium ultimum (strain ATCC 200006 / CBS 805.95 / DAOM BR144) TaxID=431595 RepID=K3WV01_GLOUD
MRDPKQQQPQRDLVLVSSSRDARTAAAKPISKAASSSVAAAKAALKTPPSNNARGPSSTTASICKRTTSGSQSTLQKKVNDVFTRMQPHNIVQSYEKLLSSLKVVPSVCLNSNVLTPVAPTASSLSAGWKAAQHDASQLNSSTNAHNVSVPSKCNPSQGSFHYAHSVQYALPDPTLSLTTIKSLQVSLTSSLSRTPIEIGRTIIPPTTMGAARKKLDPWRCVATSSAQIGLALYELPLLGDEIWRSSCSTLVALVWTQSLEVVKLYLQLNLTQLLYAAVQRPIRIMYDDVDPIYGRHSFVAAITIRSFDHVLWEKELYGIDLSSNQQTVALTTELLNDLDGYRDRTRFMDAASSGVALPVTTDAISYGMDNVLLVDVTVWEPNCQPIWGFSAPLRASVCSPSASSVSSGFSLSGAGDAKQLLEMKYEDDAPQRPAHGNTFMITLEKIQKSNDGTFGTRYASGKNK